MNGRGSGRPHVAFSMLPHPDQLRDFLADRDVPCPECGSHMVMKLSRMGVFMSCSRFPDCKGSRTEKGEIIKP